LSKLVFQTNIIRTGQTIYIKVIAEEITIVEVSKKTSMEIALGEAVFKIIDLVTVLQ
jgi:hypothetical protein